MAEAEETDMQDDASAISDTALIGSQIGLGFLDAAVAAGRMSVGGV